MSAAHGAGATSRKRYRGDHNRTGTNGLLKSPECYCIHCALAKGNAMQVQPYLFFEGRCEEALEFYRRALGAEVTMLTRFKDAPDPGMAPPNASDKVMHVSFRIGETTVLASDGRCSGKPNFQGFSLTLLAA